jgi:ergothioneine biosynthesis protein EgtB
VAFDSDDRQNWRAAVARVRARTLALAAPLSPEDMQAQSMADASPAKWHLAHTTWFFDEFVLGPAGASPPAPEGTRYLFNSYYEAVGERHPRPDRGLVTRPTVAEILDWRRAMDAALDRFCETAPAAAFAAAAPLIELGQNHEEQHQELILMDILSLFARHPLAPAYRTDLASAAGPDREQGWISHQGGLVEIGAGPQGFAFDNERPRHKVWLEPFALADRLVSNGDWLAFMADAGYATPTLWLADGWDCVRRESWAAPFHWRESDNGWSQVTLAGLEPVDPAAPVVHVSYYEAEAFARWAGARLPTEAEWEAVAEPQPVDGNFLENDILRPAPSRDGSLFGDVWQWTSSAYGPYPGFQPGAGAVGEYNGKFMSGKFVLKGGACITPRGHLRASYRNFFEPQLRWMFAGLRLAGAG